MTNLPQSGYIKTFANFKNQKQDQKKKGKGSNCKKTPLKSNLNCLGSQCGDFKMLLCVLTPWSSSAHVWLNSGVEGLLSFFWDDQRAGCSKNVIW